MSRFSLVFVVLSGACLSGSACSNSESSSSPTPDGAGTQDATTGSGDASGSPDDGGGSDAAGEGGLPPSTACAENADCRAGTCFEGVCICDDLHWVQPDGTCGTTEPPDCEGQGGMCRQGATECDPGETKGSGPAVMSCGDLIAAMCCFAACKGPADFVCCAGDQELPPVCVHGWKTCDEGQRAVKPSDGCGE